MVFGTFSACLAHFLVVQGTLEVAQVIDEQSAVQMVGFMLHGCAVVAFAFKVDGVAVKIKGIQGDAAGALDHGPIVRHGKASFVFGVKRGIKHGDAGVYQSLEFLRRIGIFKLLREVENNHPLEYADLGRGNAHARRWP